MVASLCLNGIYTISVNIKKNFHISLSFWATIDRRYPLEKHYMWYMILNRDYLLVKKQTYLLFNYHFFKEWGGTSDSRQKTFQQLDLQGMVESGWECVRNWKLEIMGQFLLLLFSKKKLKHVLLTYLLPLLSFSVVRLNSSGP